MRKGFALLEILLVLLVIAILYVAMTMYYKKPMPDKESQKLLSSQGIDTTSYKTILDSTKKKLQDVSKQNEF